MDKRGGLTFSVYIFMFFRFIVLLIVALGAFAFVAHFIKTTFDITETESEIFIQGIYNMGTSYHEKETGRNYPGIIDYQEFTSTMQSRIENALYSDKPAVAAKTELQDLDGKPYKKARPLYYNKKMYDVWLPLSSPGLIGKGSATRLVKAYQVIVKEGDEFHKGNLKVTILMPNS